MIADDGTAWVMDISGDHPVFTQTDAIGSDRIWSNLTVLPDGRVMISGGSAVDNQLTGVNESVEVWDLRTNNEKAFLKGVTPVWSVAYSPGGKLDRRF